MGSVPLFETEVTSKRGKPEDHKVANSKVFKKLFENLQN